MAETRRVTKRGKAKSYDFERNDATEQAYR